jgi:hypothetical protein
MRVYSCSGWAFDDYQNGERFYSTRLAALDGAKAATAPDPDVRQMPTSATVRVHWVRDTTVAGVVDLLNGEGWCTRSQILAVVTNGEVDEGQTEAAQANEGVLTPTS